MSKDESWNYVDLRFGFTSGFKLLDWVPGMGICIRILIRQFLHAQTDTRPTLVFILYSLRDGGGGVGVRFFPRTDYIDLHGKLELR